jgi:hypothetical protein
MAKKSFASAMKLGWAEAIRLFAAVFASGKNPDGTDFFLPTGAELTLDPTNLALDATLQSVLEALTRATAVRTHTTSNDLSGGAVDISAAPVAGQKLVLTGLIISAGAAMNVTLKEQTSGTVLAGPFYLPANGSVVIPPGSRILKTQTADKKIQAIASVAGGLTIETWAFSEA